MPFAGPEPLPGVFGSIAPVIHHHGYLAIAIIVCLANIGLPAPAEASVVTGAVFASRGQLDLTTIATVAGLAAVIGSLIGYVIGVRAGHPLLLRYGAKVRLTESRVERAEGFMRRRGVPLVVVMRFLPVLRRIGGLTAGTSEMPLAQFAVANLIGAAIWSSAWVEIGNQAGAHLDRLSKVLSGRGVILAGAAVVVLALGALAVRRRSAPNHPEPETP